MNTYSLWDINDYHLSRTPPKTLISAWGCSGGFGLEIEHQVTETGEKFEECVGMLQYLWSSGAILSVQNVVRFASKHLLRRRSGICGGWVWL